MIILITVLPRSSATRELHYVHCKYIGDESSDFAINLSMQYAGKWDFSTGKICENYLKGIYKTSKSFSFSGSKAFVRVEVLKNE